MSFIYDLVDRIFTYFFATFKAWFYPPPCLELIPTPKMSLKGRIVVYSIVGCPHCMRAKNTLQEQGLPYADISLDAFPQEREYVKTRTGKTTVPQIFFNSVHVGGNDDLEKLVSVPVYYLKVILHYVLREARYRVICSREDALAFTPQVILRVVACVQHAKTLMSIVPGRTSLCGQMALRSICWWREATLHDGVKAPVDFPST